jgi:hypothetical protein
MSEVEFPKPPTVTLDSCASFWVSMFYSINQDNDICFIRLLWWLNKLIHSMVLNKHLFNYGVKKACIYVNSNSSSCHLINPFVSDTHTYIYIFIILIATCSWYSFYRGRNWAQREYIFVQGHIANRYWQKLRFKPKFLSGGNEVTGTRFPSTLSN